MQAAGQVERTIIQWENVYTHTPNNSSKVFHEHQGQYNISPCGILPRRLIHIHHSHNTYMFASNKQIYVIDRQLLNHKKNGNNNEKGGTTAFRIPGVPETRGDIVAVYGRPSNRRPGTYHVILVDEHATAISLYFPSTSSSSTSSMECEYDFRSGPISSTILGSLCDTHPSQLYESHAYHNTIDVSPDETHTLISDQNGRCVRVFQDEMVVRTIHPISQPSGDCKFGASGSESGHSVLVLLEGGCWSKWDIRAHEKGGLVGRHAPSGYGNYGTKLFALDMDIDMHGSGSGYMAMGGESRSAILYDARVADRVLSQWSGCVQHDITYLKLIRRRDVPGLGMKPISANFKKRSGGTEVPMTNQTSIQPQSVLVAGAHNELAYGAWTNEDADLLRMHYANHSNSSVSQPMLSSSGGSHSLHWSMYGAQLMASGAFITNEQRVLGIRLDDRILGIQATLGAINHKLDRDGLTPTAGMRFGVITASNALYQLDA